MDVPSLKFPVNVCASFFRDIRPVSYTHLAGFDFSRCPYRQLAAEYMQLYPARLLECPLQPHAQQVLAALKARGARQVVLSASEQAMLDEQLAHFGLTGYFEEVLGLTDFYGRSKVQRGLARCV